MRNLKKYVRLIFAAVVCLFLGMKKDKSGKTPAVGFAGAGNGFGTETWGMSGCREGAGMALQKGCGAKILKLRSRNTVMNEKRRRRIQEKFFWLKGPGDRPRSDERAFLGDSA